MRVIPFVAAVCAVSLAAAHAAQAGLIGQQVTYEYFYPDSSSLYFSLPETTISTGTSLVDMPSNITTTFSNSQIIIRNNYSSGFTGASLNGPEYIFSSNIISGVSIDAASAADFLGVVSFTADSIEVNFSGLYVDTGSQLILDVTTQSSPVPEPSSIAVLGAGLACLAGLGLSRRRMARSPRPGYAGAGM